MELQQLLKECKKRSVTAQKYLFDHYAVPMFLLCRRYVKADETAEEVMMNGFLKFFNSLEVFNYVNDAATSGWLKKIMVNECLMYLRSNNSFLQVAMDDIPEVILDEEIISGISADEILRLITKLPLGYRTVFNLHEIENYSHKEIAEVLGISEGTSKSQLNKARAMLQQLLIQNNSEYAGRKSK
ncbi:MAG TPA: sigma-70 family RNA polymerase sigma factor [Chitinophagaceae bacterium]|nr:sigma-70 family RNA polymerase sigma factor [Chitinophagaceae bacterium]